MFVQAYVVNKESLEWLELNISVNVVLFYCWLFSI